VKRMLKKLVLCMVSIGVIMSFVGGVASAQEKLTFWTMESFLPAELEFYQTAAKEFGKLKGVDVEVTAISHYDIPAKLFPAIEAGNPPDVAYMHDWNAIRVESAVADLTELWSDIAYMYGGWTPFGQRAFTMDGKVFGIGLLGMPEMVHVRKDLLALAGVTLPRTWEDIRQAAIKTNRPEEGIYGYGQPIASRTTWDAEKPLRMLLWGEGQGLVAADGKTITVNNPKNIELIRWYLDLYLKDKVIPPGAASWGGSDNNIWFQQGRSAICINTGTLAFAIFTNPEYADLAKNTELIMTPAGSKGSYTFSGLYVFQTYKASKNPQLAKDFIRYFYTKDVQNRFWDAIAGAYATPLFDLLKHPAFKVPPFDIYARVAQSIATPGYPGPITVPMGELMGVNAVSDMMARIALGQMTVEQSVAELEKQMKEVYNKYYPGAN